MQEKTPYDSSLGISADPKTLPQSPLNAASIDVWHRRKKWWDDIEIQKVTAEKQTKSLTHVKKKRLTTRGAGSSQIQTHGRDPHRMRHWLMYDTSKTIGQKRSKSKKRTTLKHSPINQKRRYGTPTPNLRPSDSIFLIYIRLSFDWCMRQVKQLVRRDRNRKKGQQLTRQIHLPLNQKRRYGTPTPHLLQSDSIFRICIWFLFDWCMIQSPTYTLCGTPHRRSWKRNSSFSSLASVTFS